MRSETKTSLTLLLSIAVNWYESKVVSEKLNQNKFNFITLVMSSRGWNLFKKASHSEFCQGHSEFCQGHCEFCQGHSEFCQGHSEFCQGHSDFCQGHS